MQARKNPPHANHAQPIQMALTCEVAGPSQMGLPLDFPAVAAFGCPWMNKVYPVDAVLR